MVHMDTNLLPPKYYRFESASKYYIIDLFTNRLFLLSKEENLVFEKLESDEELEYLAGKFPKGVSSIKQMMDEGLFCSDESGGLGISTGVFVVDLHRSPQAHVP